MVEKSSAASDNDFGQASDKDVSLSFKVSPDFRKRFKGFAVAQGMSMTDLLKEGFALSQKTRPK